jgi:hypothetical protein
MKPNETEPAGLSEMAERLLELVRRRRCVSFVEMEREIEGFGGGDMSLGIENDKVSNIMLWWGMTPAAVDAMAELRKQQLIHPIPTTILTYMIDGRVPQLPLAKGRRHYKKLHWAPTVFNPGPHGNNKKRR